jgi:T-complex protein 1 subunit theta
MGLHPSEILIGYEKAGKKCLELLDTLVAYTIENIRDRGELVKVLKSVVGSKHYGNENILAPLIAEAALYAMPRTSRDFNVENIRVQKVLGASLADSKVIHGMAVLRGSENRIKHVKDAKIAVYNTAIELNTGDTKGTVLLKTAEELMNYT